MSAQTFRISSSVERAMAGLPRSEPIPAWSFVQALGRVHPDYAGGGAGRLAEDKGPAPGARHRVDEWLQRIRDLYDPTRAEVLDTRLTILGLARLESSLAEYLASVGALGALEAEVEKESGMALGNLLVDRDSDPDGGAHRSIHEQTRYAPSGASNDGVPAEDLLGFRRAAAALASVIVRPETVPPLVVGVYGPWGSGKSTFLREVQKRLAALSPTTGAADAAGGRVVVVEYDAWAYADAGKLWAGLVTTIARQLEASLTPWNRLRYAVTRRVRRAVPTLLLAALTVVGIVVTLYLAKTAAGWDESIKSGTLTLFSGFLSTVSGYFLQKKPASDKVEALASNPGAAPVSGIVHKIQDELKEVLRAQLRQFGVAATGSDEPVDITAEVRQNRLKIVVFIDELDRCPLERVVDILEAIKLFLAEEIFVVLLAIDTRVAAEAIRLRYKDVRNRELPREYLEKIVQLPLRVPTAEPASIEDYLRSLMHVSPTGQLRRDGLPTASRQTSAAMTPSAATATGPDSGGSAGRTTGTSLAVRPLAAGTQVPATRGGTAPEPDDDLLGSLASLPRIPDTDTEFRVLSDLSGSLLEGNPRRIKRLVNTYRFVKVLAHWQGEDIQSDAWQRAMLAWLACTMNWPAFMMAAAREAASTTASESTAAFWPRVAREALGAAVPSEDILTRYVAIDPAQLRRFGRYADNFLIESPLPDGEAADGESVRWAAPLPSGRRRSTASPAHSNGSPPPRPSVARVPQGSAHAASGGAGPSHIARSRGGGTISQ